MFRERAYELVEVKLVLWLNRQWEQDLSSLLELFKML